jgi:hypothetical protein
MLSRFNGEFFHENSCIPSSLDIMKLEVFFLTTALIPNMTKSFRAREAQFAQSFNSA